MADFEALILKVIEREGGYRFVDVPGDIGGLTYAGISKKYNPTWPGWKLPKNHSLLPEYADKLYEKKYWKNIKGYRIRSNSKAMCIFSCAVLSGSNLSIRISQRILSKKVDGIMGFLTLDAINSCDEDPFLLAFTLARINRYTEIVKKNHSQRKFFLGWVTRALQVLEDAIQ